MALFTMKRILLSALFIFSFSSCELLEEETTDDTNDVQNIPDEQLFVRHAFPSMYYPPEYNMTEDLASRTFESAYWNQNELRFNDDSAGYISYVEVRDINITGTGQYPILNEPLGVISQTNVGLLYTDVVPLFWTDGTPNNGTLVQGGIGYDLSYYDNVPETIIPQGGYLVITDHNSRYLAGELYFTAWRYDNQLNREVAYWTYIEFSGVPYQN
jgi:hypothetical protein